MPQELEIIPKNELLLFYRNDEVVFFLHYQTI